MSLEAFTSTNHIQHTFEPQLSTNWALKDLSKGGPYPSKDTIDAFITLQVKELQGISIRLGVDGEGGSGKENLTSELSGILGIPSFDSGKYYRAITAVTSDEVIQHIQHDEHALQTYLDSLDITVTKDAQKKQHVTVTKNKGTTHEEIIDITELVGTSSVSERTSSIASIQLIRNKVHAYQNTFMETNSSFIIEGRNMYEIASGKANFMIYLHAEDEEILRREMGRQDSSVDAAFKSALVRTQQDTNRKGEGKFMTREQAYQSNSPYDLCIDTSFIPKEHSPLIVLNALVEHKQALQQQPLA